MNNTITIETLSAFRARLAREEKSAGTIENYLRDAEAFAVWLGDAALTREAVAAWRDSLVAAGLKAATVNAKLASVSALLRHMDREDCRARSLRLQQRTFRDAERELTQEEFYRLVKAAKRLGRTRAALLLEAIGSTGVRVSEVQFLTVEAAKRGEAVVHNKGKTRVVMLPRKLQKKLLEYAKKHGIVKGSIFTGKTGAPLSHHRIWEELKALCEEAGVSPQKVFPHNLRHLFAVEFYRVCKDVIKLADVLGHSSVNTTRIYLLTSGEEHRRVLEHMRMVS
ncbi:MAG: tyrosine-type recombinase/integrase [Oscillospiraceae bacterium]|nr:tyrosine-type recombinase/integrase [Oscillospiraceae bacterium]